MASSFTVEGTTAGSGMTIPESNTASYGFIKIMRPSAVTLNGGTCAGNTDNGFFVMIRNRPSEDGESGSATINGGTYSAPNGFGAYVFNSGGIIVVNSGTISGGSAAVKAGKTFKWAMGLRSSLLLSLRVERRSAHGRATVPKLFLVHWAVPILLT